MLRRNARLRREYLYRKGLEGKERAEYERKRLIREALAGKAGRDGGERRRGCARRRRPLNPTTTSPRNNRGQTPAHRAAPGRRRPETPGGVGRRQHGRPPHPHRRRVRPRGGAGAQGEWWWVGAAQPSLSLLRRHPLSRRQIPIHIDPGHDVAGPILPPDPVRQGAAPRLARRRPLKPGWHRRRRPGRVGPLPRLHGRRRRPRTPWPARWVGRMSPTLWADGLLWRVQCGE